MTLSRPAGSLLGVGLVVAAMHSVAVAGRIGNCPGGRFAPALSTAVGLPFEDASSRGGAFTVKDGLITLGACPGTPAPVAIVRHGRRWRARWDTCGPFAQVRLRLELGPGGQCDYLVGVIRYRDGSGHRRGFKFPADRVGEP